VFAAVLDINLTGTMRACVAARPLLAASRGSVVNIASMLSFLGERAYPLTARAKAA
jgi:NAD(P)-dependent dehydrogenase (short-subunit alcohol dehydrogenase family)